MHTQETHQTIDRYRDYATAFSRRAFTDVLEFNDYSVFNRLVAAYGQLNCTTYLQLLEKLYAQLIQHYRCEYVFKNELVNQLLAHPYTKQLLFSEFRIGKSIADLASFHEESIAYEIKTAYDTPKRLGKQLSDYKRLFDKCYLVVPAEKIKEYTAEIDSETGIIALSLRHGSPIFEEIKPAKQNQLFDTDLLLSCLRIAEYTHMATALGIDLKPVPGYELSPYCRSAFRELPITELRKQFLLHILQRKNPTPDLSNYPAPLRQMVLSLNLTAKKTRLLLTHLNQMITA